MTRRPTLAAALCALVAAAASALDTAPVVSPPEPAVGDEVTVDYRLENLDAAGAAVRDFALPEGLALLGTRLQPERAFDGSGTLREVLRLSVTFRAVEAGVFELPPISVTARGAVRATPRVVLRVSAAADSSEPLADWAAPAAVYAGQAFALSAVGLPEGAFVRPPAVPGLALERRGPASFVALSLASRADPPAVIELPAATARADVGPRHVRGARIRVMPWNARGTERGAVGRIALSVAAAKTSGHDFAITVSGSGNLPILPAPRFSVRGPDGSVLPPEAVTVSRLDRYAATDSGYAGSVDFLVAVAPDAAKPGRRTVAFSPYAALDPASGDVKTISLQPFVFTLASSGSKADPVRDAFAALAAPPAGAGAARAAWISGIAKGAKGDLAGAVRDLYAAERLGERHPAFRAALETLRSLTGVDARPRDLLPPPAAFRWAVAAALACALVAAAVALARILGIARPKRSRSRPRPERRHPNAAAFGRVLGFVAIALAFALCALVSAADRRRVFVVSPGGPVRAAPGQAASVAFEIPAGAAGIERAAVDGWNLVEFPDGRKGWLVDDQGLEY